ncbi:tripartite tricarboxylate transporter receptor family protein [Hydrogenophaga sp. RAC07]|mgnify:CR=1 FL=1|uniref:Bug family tripartite tricarboxylate transporter substrate binding protein n=1 Tax=Hydrogenophaga sp. RAC07 TaxID=1842537 RepID=UPI00083DE187|nr:tripartite tricarboxylate transporter substrate binding protein [Hydrogenophaga sp. RAC07]AOF87320.1 tripartite tricarboxylate transporter receptor family protein [Hydrogenophaga sp. RAC07]
MKASRSIIATAVLTAFTASTAWSQATSDWRPTKTVRIVVPIVGSTNDVLARLLAPKLQEALGQPFVVENKGGAGGNIGALDVVKSAPDGHTLLVGYNGPLAINVTLFDNMPYDPVKDLAPITLAVKAPQYLVVNPATGITSVQDFIAKAKANPTKYSYGSVSLGSASHLTMEMMKSEAGFRMTHIPYRGAGPAVADLLAGNVQAGFFVPGNVQGFVKEGKLKLLATSGTKRFDSTPDIPTLNESGLKDFEATSWIGFLAPAGTPPNIIARYNQEMVRIINSPEIKARLKDMEFEIVASSPQEFSNWISTEIVRWGKVIKDTGAKVN